MTIDFSKIDREKYFFDSYTSDRAIRFIETFCTHVKGNAIKLRKKWPLETK
ncbi:hypothetical protein SAMN04488057_117111 [Cyclobacterium lianum]|uniref:Uncharacterized protein n=1 Tax=Cyclobacterium lianum TaxID=388280 RepID=A0A1M7QFZ0_9BACT|nr:hypothetical protein SAMN04488057_117111 [Cyclobacterium lianum]